MDKVPTRFNSQSSSGHALIHLTNLFVGSFCAEEVSNDAPNAYFYDNAHRA